jgi:hypothetical protein
LKSAIPVRPGVYVALAGIITSVVCLIIGSHHPNLPIGIVLRVVFKPILFLSDLSVHLIFLREGVAPSQTEARVFNWLFVTYSGMLGFAIGLLGALSFQRRSRP